MSQEAGQEGRVQGTGPGWCGGEQDMGGDDTLVPCTAAGSWLTLRRTIPEEAGGPGGSSEEWVMQEGP